MFACVCKMGIHMEDRWRRLKVTQSCLQGRLTSTRCMSCSAGEALGTGGRMANQQAKPFMLNAMKKTHMHSGGKERRECKIRQMVQHVDECCDVHTCKGTAWQNGAASWNVR